MIAAPSISGIAYALPACTRTVRELSAAGQLASEPALLEEFGFRTVRVATTESSFDLAREAGSAVLAQTGVRPTDIDLLIYGGLPGAHAFGSAGAAGERDAISTTERFKYPATRLQYELGLDSASVFALDQLACTSLFGAVRIARSLCLSEGLEQVLCVGSDFYPAEAGREAIFNCTSDAACAVIVSRTGARCRIRAATSVTKGYYWDSDALRNEIVASYFPTSAHVIERTLAAAGWKRGDVDWIIPHNVSLRSWQILSGLLRIPLDRVWTANIAGLGHTLAGDNFINLCDALSGGSVSAGDRLLLFSYGYGAHWTALAVEA